MYSACVISCTACLGEVGMAPAWSNAAESSTWAAFGLEGHGLSEGSEALGISSRVRRAAPSLRMLAEETVEASHGLAKTATLAMLWRRRWRGSCRPP